MLRIEHGRAPLDRTDDLVFKEFDLAMHLQGGICRLPRQSIVTWRVQPLGGKIPRFNPCTKYNKDKFSNISIIFH
jgi:hypothetical protein